MKSLYKLLTYTRDNVYPTIFKYKAKDKGILNNKYPLFILIKSYIRSIINTYDIMYEDESTIYISYSLYNKYKNILEVNAFTMYTIEGEVIII